MFKLEEEQFNLLMDKLDEIISFLSYMPLAEESHKVIKNSKNRIQQLKGKND